MIVSGIQATDVQLSHCFRTLCSVTKRVHKTNMFHNFASAGFHLCYILKVMHTMVTIEVTLNNLASLGNPPFAEGQSFAGGRVVSQWNCGRTGILFRSREAPNSTECSTWHFSLVFTRYSMACEYFHWQTKDNSCTCHYSPI